MGLHYKLLWFILVYFLLHSLSCFHILKSTDMKKCSSFNIEMLLWKVYNYILAFLQGA